MKIIVPLKGKVGNNLNKSIEKDIKSRFKSENANVCCRFFLSFGLLSKNINIKIYRTIIWSVVLYGSET
jgi:hypothetical protein